MATVVQFVDSIAASPTVRCDLNSQAGGLMVGDPGLQAPPPELQTATASTLLNDGDRVVASAYGNRELGIPLELLAATADAGATTLQTLARELDRPTNILKVQLSGMTAPVFFRTFRASDYTLAILKHQLTSHTSPVLTIEAEPFALGLMETITPAAVSNDPAAGSNGRFMDITGVKGDVETPLTIKVSGAAVAGKQGLFATRRRGTPPSYFLQTEAMTLGTDTALVATNAAYSGSGSNSVSTTFATVTTSAVRLSTTTFPATPSVDMRGTYRVFGRFASNTTGAQISVILEHGIRATKNPATVFTQLIGGTYQNMTDLGLVQIPEGQDPGNDGPGGIALQVVGIPLKIYAERLTGSGTFISDYLLFVPADDQFAIVSWGSSTPTQFVFDGTTRTVYGLDASGRIADIVTPRFVGTPPMVSPGVTNRLHYINDVSPQNTVSDGVGTTVTLNPTYWPRYLNPFRPATT